MIDFRPSYVHGPTMVLTTILGSGHRGCKDCALWESQTTEWQNWDLTQVCDRQDALVFIGQQREVGEPGHQLYLSDLPKTT